MESKKQNNKIKKLNLGSGEDIKEGFVNLDIAKLKGIDIVHNLDKYPWPLKDNEFDFVYCDNVLEHLSEIPKPMEELWRITKNSGKIKIIVPIFPSVWAMSDPTHKSFYTYMTFDYFTNYHELKYYSKARFKIIKRKIIFHPYLRLIEKIVNINELTKKSYTIFLSFLIPAMFLHVDLETEK
ncbi:MAG: methyltransferase domain-containing protein [archaeon]|nr:methyltransferase domain-containing protein [archaeon]